MHDGDILREGVRMLAHALMEAEVETHVAAAPHERTATRTGQRNGCRERAWDTRGNRSRGSVGDAHQVTGPATSGVAWGQAEAGRSWGTARSAMLAVQTPAR